MSYLNSKSTKELYGKKYAEMLKRSKARPKDRLMKPTISKTSVHTATTGDSGIGHDAANSNTIYDSSAYVHSNGDINGALSEHVSKEAPRVIVSNESNQSIKVDEDNNYRTRKKRRSGHSDPKVETSSESPPPKERPETKGSIGLFTEKTLLLVETPFSDMPRSGTSARFDDQNRSKSEPPFLPPIGRTPRLTTPSRYAVSLSPPSRQAIADTMTPLSTPNPSKSPFSSRVDKTSSLDTTDIPMNLSQDTGLDTIDKSGEIQNYQNPISQLAILKKKRRRLKFEKEMTFVSRHEEYKKQRRELTKTLHLKAGHIGFHTRPPIRRDRDNRVNDESQKRMSSNEDVPKKDERSIRQTIEQFKKRQDDQYKDKLQKLRLDSERERTTYNVTPMQNQDALQSILQKYKKTDDMSVDERPPLGHLSPRERLDPIDRNYQDAPDGILRKVSTDSLQSKNSKNARLTADNFENNADTIAIRESISAGTTKTWRTWRDVNDSYAYNDVAKYIEENDLMNKEKEDYITRWVGEVDRSRFIATPMTEPGVPQEGTQPVMTLPQEREQTTYSLHQDNQNE